MLLKSSDSSGAATVPPQLLSLAAPSEQQQEGIRAKNEVTLGSQKSPSTVRAAAPGAQMCLIHLLTMCRERV